MHRLALIFFVTIFSYQALASSESSAVFYPLPSQAEGTFINAKNLFLYGQGGLWIHDVHGQVLFYDGQTTLPDTGSILQKNTEEVAYQNDAFWTFFDNEVFKVYPNQEQKLVFSLRPGSKIRKIGTSKDYIWVSDGTYFHVYNTITQQRDKFSLLQLYQHSNNRYVYINDAILVDQTWVIGTTAGVYFSDKKRLKHITTSGTQYIETLYYSSKRRELLVGTLTGTLFYETEQGIDIIDSVSIPHVLAFAETDLGYWIGTEQGLYLFSFSTGEVNEMLPIGFLDGPPAHTKIYSLLNDNMGGMWMATDRGIWYYSEFSQIFKRTSLAGKHRQVSTTYLRQTLIGPDNSLWFTDGQALYHSTSGGITKVLNVESQLNAFTFQGENIWLATKMGLEVYNLTTLKRLNFPYLKAIAEESVDHIVTDGIERLWVSRGHELLSINTSTKEVRNLGSDWLVSNFLPSKITRLYYQDSLLLIGTDHGVYEYDGKKIRFDHLSTNSGESLDIITAANGERWFASTNGVFKHSAEDNETRPIELSVPNALPACMISDRNGVWLASSVGLSYYNLEGQLLNSYSSSFGLIYNEFLPGVCTSTIDTNSSHNINQQGLVFGSIYGLVQANASQLLHTHTPESKIIISRIRIGNKLDLIGNDGADKSAFPYGTSLSILFGLMPKLDHQKLYYRLREDQAWKRLENGQLTLEYLSSGEYNLQVSIGRRLAIKKTDLEYQFTVLKPWYLSIYAQVFFVALLLLVIMFAIFWRSRCALRARLELAAQVKLKTAQLRHQSRVLLMNNQQLRKQIQVRNLLVDHMARSIKSSIEAITMTLVGDQNEKVQHHLSNTHWQLNELIVEPDQYHEGSQSYNLSQFIQAVIDVWQADFARMKISIELIDEYKNQSIKLESFNLDIILNIIFANVLKRSFQCQKMIVTLEKKEQGVALCIIDYGMPLSTLGAIKGHTSKLQADLSIENLPFLVEESGGQLSIFSSDSQNKIEITWPFAFRSKSDLQSISYSEVSVDNENSPSHLPCPEKEWLLKVYTLVADNYQNPEFGTASAAKMLFMSERSLQRRFKSATSTTLSSYLTEIRLELACEQLLEGVKISEVAFNCGFNDPSYFSQKFKLHFGLSPSKFVISQKIHNDIDVE
ncbi:AraC family transcriptional regulator [Vibrio sagamiensis]|uniref:AraC family transcriptional regulator n=1 Tax=Vibrio sagamiensis NBRC 104589 TaxID=1219064 RepID=A0A511QBS5_9VIBR|nr:AraC family transcriptional regulator [Vibrio sagamiensis]PNQ68931.1 AraC family transcriptional regulator [Vibrio agarivorans]GEM74750.1 AraC family transcriptional regulator [Vibrio sagamiensis NBRC 104589]